MRRHPWLWHRGAVRGDFIVDLFHARAFAIGLAYGGIGFFLAASVGAVGRRRSLDFAALAFVAAAWLGIRGAWGPDLASGATALALAALALGGACVFLLSRHVPGAADHPLLAAS